MLYIFDNVVVKTSVRPNLAAAGAIEGAAVDTEGFLDGMAQIEVGATTGTPSSFSVAAKVQESDNGVDGWTDIAGAAITPATVINKSAQIRLAIGIRAAAKRYIRLHVTPAFVSGSSPKVNVSGAIILGSPERGSFVANSSVSA